MQLSYEESKQYQTVQALLQPLAQKMTGQYVRVRIAPTYQKFVMGRIYKSAGGELNIVLDPQQDMAGMYDSFIHEVSHILTGQAKNLLDPLEGWKEPRYTKEQNENFERVVVDPMEDENKSYAAELDRRVTEKAIDEFGRSDAYTKFITLDYFTEHIIKSIKG
jgi:hypothetical protein